ncbi:SLBB domain-containing protein [Leptolyngbya sp. FACHB-321]|uniref:polysaccharide biosynthesis/export family protein n=1 Tax=Leptolyngbya sp. FACHB-321 TaxID=2692807 RepID=UPI001683091E|nr:polysaccharide biosynthesis/export family protein [Leptolyngbya sp. FACHB-321]MBD2036633.1 SLBB domain-containing protein [Leptolyngbya sp. FACHB-321]
MPLAQPFRLAKQTTCAIDWLPPTIIVGSLFLASVGTAQVPNRTLNPSVLPTNASLTQAEDGYLLGSGDRVRIDFFNVPEYSGEYLVLPNGAVNLPQVGAVPVQGRTLKQAAAAIAARYEPYLTRPLVTIGLLSARPLAIAIAGEINRPGTYNVQAISANADTGVPSVTRLIQLAGGVTQAADVRQVEVRRPRPYNAGADEVIKVDLWELLKAGNLRQDLRLQDGDSIFIPSATSVDLNEAQRLAAATIAAPSDRPMRIAVVGEVNRPGPYILTPDQTNPTNQTNGASSTPLPTNANLKVPTVTRAIQTAGGITQTADIRNVEVRRTTQAGPVQTIKVDFWSLLQAGDLRQDLPLQEGDTIVIPTAPALDNTEATKIAAASFAPDRITVNVVGEVVRSGPVQVPPNTPLNQALLAAGGFNNRAKKGEVTFIRLNQNGTVARRNINVDFAQGISEANNPPMRNNDTIVVRRSGLATVSDTLGSVLSPIGGVFSIINLLGF